MLLSHKTIIKVNTVYSNIIGHMCYAAYKLWNVCNYERIHYKELGLTQYPDWYYQKKLHKTDLWYKQLPSQTAQEVCKLLDKSWKSFYKLKNTGGIINPKPPYFKHEGIAITYMQNAIVHEPGSSVVRLTLSQSLKQYMSGTYGICDTYLFLENKIFRNTDTIKQIKLYPPADGRCKVIVIYDIPDVEILPDNGKYLSLCHYYNKEIARVQSQWSSTQYKHSVKYTKPSRHVLKLYEKKNNAIKGYLHKVTRYIVAFCKEHDIRTVVVGDITGIREKNNQGAVNNQNFHALPYKKIYTMLEYKLALEGIKTIHRKESYSSQCSPLSPEVAKQYARKSNRVKRGLYKDGEHSWNADCVGAYNILRLYLKDINQTVTLFPYEIKSPYVAKVAV